MRNAFRSLSSVSFVVVWLSFPLLVLGDYLRTNSWQFQDWLRSIHSQYQDLPGAGLFLLFFSPSSILFHLLLVCFAAGYICVMLDLAKSSNLVTKLVSILLCGLWIRILELLVNSAQKNLSWHFSVYATGELFLAAGGVLSLVAYGRVLAADS